jgi:regulator of protease activity HflC (stomatin/prohibitin superfamily)
MEKIIKPLNGYIALALLLGLVAIGGYFLIKGLVVIDNAGNITPWMASTGIAMLLVVVVIYKGMVAIEPNYAMTFTLFGKYVGTSKTEGLQFVNPIFKKLKVDLRARSLESTKLKVNDKLGNPIEIAAVIVWQIKDTYKAVFEVSNINDYIKNQSEAALRHLATSYPYDNIEHDDAHITLRDGADKVIEMLENELGARLTKAGIIIHESRISHLAYAPEIAGAMLQRQQATAIVAARTKIVEGAVTMVEMALDQLSKKEIVVLDDEKKAAMVSNLMVVLCGEKSASPVVNAGTLYA